jgi:RNA polymerase sigma-70 factor (ECF subfamily)
MPEDLKDDPSDAALMASVAENDMDALELLVRRHQASALSTAYRILARWDQAEDVAQEVFIRVYQAAGSYVPTAAFTTWMYRIVVNLCRDHLRKRRPNLEPPEDLGDSRGEAPAQVIARAEHAEAVRKAVDRLPERQRITVILHRFSGLSHAEIAEATGWSVAAVESCLVRAYAALRQGLSELGNS